MVATLPVKSGDSLWELAERHTGDGRNWRALVLANPHKRRTLAGTFRVLTTGERLVKPLYWPNEAPETGDLTSIEKGATAPTAPKTTTSGQTMTPRNFARALLAALGAPQTEDAVNAIVIWVSLEGGHYSNAARFNPLNTSRAYPGSTLPFPSTSAAAHIRAYPSWAAGIDATKQTIEQQNFSAIRSAFLRGAGMLEILDALDGSPTSVSWVTGRANDPTKPYRTATHNFSPANLDSRLLGWSNKPDPLGAAHPPIPTGPLATAAAGGAAILVVAAAAVGFYLWKKRRR